MRRSQAHGEVARHLPPAAAEKTAPGVVRRDDIERRAALVKLGQSLPPDCRHHADAVFAQRRPQLPPGPRPLAELHLLERNGVRPAVLSNRQLDLANSVSRVAHLKLHQGGGADALDIALKPNRRRGVSNQNHEAYDYNYEQQNQNKYRPGPDSLICSLRSACQTFVLPEPQNPTRLPAS